MTNLPNIGDSFTLEYDYEVENESGRIAQIPAGTPFKIIEQDGSESFAVQYEQHGSIAFGAEAVDITVYSPSDRSGQSDTTESSGILWFDIDPAELTII
jgi:hypothetical protein